MSALQPKSGRERFTARLWREPTCWNPNARLDVESVTVEVLPDKFTTCGLPGALSVMVSDALRSPVSEGVKDTVTVHVAPTASEAPHVFVSVKSLELAPEIAMPEIVWALSPFVSVTVCDELVVCKLCAGKTKPAGFRAKPARMLTFATYASRSSTPMVQT